MVLLRLSRQLGRKLYVLFGNVNLKVMEGQSGQILSGQASEVAAYHFIRLFIISTLVPFPNLAQFNQDPPRLARVEFIPPFCLMDRFNLSLSIMDLQCFQPAAFLVAQ